jgi:hypothetical protein
MSSTTLRPNDEDVIMSSPNDNPTLVRPTQEENPFLNKILESTQKSTKKKNETKKNRREVSPSEREYYSTLFQPDILVIRKIKNAENVDKSPPSPMHYDYNFHEDRWPGSGPFHPWSTYSTRLRTKRDWNQAEVLPPRKASKIFQSRALHSHFKQAERLELLRTWNSVRQSTVHSRQQQGNLYKSLFNVLDLKSSHDSPLSGFKIPRVRNDTDDKWEDRKKDSDSLISVNYPLPWISKF